MQPLDVAVFKSFKISWKTILDSYRKETRQKGVIQKTAFPFLLSQLWQKVQIHSGNNLKSGFRACGLVPRVPEEPIKHLPGEASVEVGRKLDSVLIQLLQENRKCEAGTKKTGRGAKVNAVPGRLITNQPCTSTTASSSVTTSRGEPSKCLSTIVI